MTGIFILDAAAARAWITDVVVAHELTEGLGELPAPDDGAPPIGMAWSPFDPGEEDTVHLMVCAAQRVGVIGKPAHAQLDFEFIDDGDEGRYRWLLDLTAPTPLKLSTLSEALRQLGDSTATGLAAAVAILHEAVEAANLLLHQLSDYVEAVTPHDHGS